LQGSCIQQSAGCHQRKGVHQVPGDIRQLERRTPVRVHQRRSVERQESSEIRLSRLVFNIIFRYSFLHLPEGTCLFATYFSYYFVLFSIIFHLHRSIYLFSFSLVPLDLTSKSGFWAKALSERHAIHDGLLFFYVDAGGDVHYGLNGESKGVFMQGIDTRSPLWVLLDIYGNSTIVEFLDCRPQLNNNRTSRRYVFMSKIDILYIIYGRMNRIA